ncbi:hypothetical protein F5883DRAFT_557913 [Diaporthe sp. PMI_573]|nr:hypothetical protein F5883DRAFT_557913 [Diaporthaceae sp. PMI_573]
MIACVCGSACVCVCVCLCLCSAAPSRLWLEAIIIRHAPRLASRACSPGNPYLGVWFLAPNAGASSQLLLQLARTATPRVDSSDNKGAK